MNTSQLPIESLGKSQNCVDAYTNEFTNICEHLYDYKKYFFFKKFEFLYMTSQSNRKKRNGGGVQSAYYS